MRPRASQPREGPAPSLDTDASAAMIAANGYVLRHLSTSLMGGSPRRLPPPGDFWEVPIMLTSPGYGAVGEVEVVTVDVRTGQVVDGTPSEQIKAAMQRLTEEKQDALEAAFLRAKST